jgi:LuxR family transcriptional regulator, maltose regulon positive regulatory protein
LPFDNSDEIMYHFLMPNHPLIVATKLSPPRYKSDAVRRDRLTSLIRNSLDKKIVAITAGPGYGKTTLLVQLLHEAKLPAVWYTLEPGDSAPAVFLAYLVNGIENRSHVANKTKRKRAVRASALLRQGAETALNHELVAGALINELASDRNGELFLVLDDYHWLADDSSVHHFMDYFIGHMPEQVHVIIATRSPLPLPSLASWRAKQELVELGQSHLAFTPSEVQDLLECQYRLSLQEAEIAGMMENTGGWITGIHLVLRTAGDVQTVQETLNKFSAANQPLFDYFAAEILARETAESRRQLVAAAHLDQVDSAGCDAVLERKGSDAILEQWARRGIFITRTGPGSYVFHPLFRQFLRDQLAEGETKRSLLRRAGDYNRRIGDYGRAIGFFMQAGVLDQAAELIAERKEDLLFLGNLADLQHWLDLMPAAQFDRHPQLLLVRGRLLRERGDHLQEIETLQRAAGLFEKHTDARQRAMALKDLGDAHYVGRDIDAALRVFQQALDCCPRTEHRLRSHILNSLGLATRDRGELDRSYRYFLQAKRSLGGDASTLSDRTSLDNNIALLFLRKGELLKGLAYYRRLMEIWSREYFLEIGVLISNAVRVGVETGHSDMAERWLEAGNKICGCYQDNVSKAALKEAGGYLRMYQGRWGDALALMEQARADYMALQYHQRAFIQYRMMARCARLQNDHQAARRYLEQFQANLANETSDRQSIQGINYLFDSSLLQIAARETTEALANAASMACAAKALKWAMGECLAHLVSAAAQFANGKTAVACRQLDQAVTLSVRNGYNGLLRGEARYNPELAAVLDARRRLPHQPAPRLRAYYHSLPKRPQLRRRVVTVLMLGPLAFRDERDRPMPVKLRTRKIASLFAYLLLHRDRVCLRDELLRALWDEGPDRNDNNLYPSVSYLKRNLSSLRPTGLPERIALVNSREHGYTLSGELQWSTDVERFTELAAAAAVFPKDAPGKDIISLCNQGVEAYRGPFLMGIEDPWVQEMRERLRSMLLAMLAILIDHYTSAGRIDQTIHHYQIYLKHDPLADQIRIKYWQALRQAGKLTDVGVDYKRHKRFLRREYNLLPTAEINAAASR